MTSPIPVAPRWRRRLLGTVLLAASAAWIGASTGAAGASASGHTQSWHDEPTDVYPQGTQVPTYGLTESRSLTTPLLASGVLYDASGAPTAGRLIAFAWPNDDMQAAAKPGDVINKVPVAYAEVEADGAYVLRADPSIEPSTYVMITRQQRALKKRPTVDFDISGFTDGAEYAESTVTREAHVTGQRVTWIQLGSDSRDLAPLNVYSIGAKRPVEGTPTHESRPAGDKACGEILVQNLGKAWTLVGEINNGANGPASFGYSSGATSELGVGFSLHAPGYGRYTQSGTIGKSSSSSVDFSNVGMNSYKRYWTTFMMALYQERSTVMSGCYTTGYQVRARYWGADNAVRNASPTSFSTCGSESAGATVTRDTQHFQTWSNGVETEGWIGIDLSARSGASSAVRTKYKWNTAGHYCGSNSGPATALRLSSKK